MSTVDVDKLVNAVYMGNAPIRTAANSENKNVIKNGLGCLGKHPLLLSHAFLELIVSVRICNNCNMKLKLSK